jgi:hypothetical protein
MSSTSTYTAPKVKDDGNTDPTQSDYAKMLHDDKTVVRNNLVTTVNMIVSSFDTVEGKKKLIMLMHLLVNRLLNNLSMECQLTFMKIKACMQLYSVYLVRETNKPATATRSV